MFRRSGEGKQREPVLTVRAIHSTSVDWTQHVDSARLVPNRYVDTVLQRRATGPLTLGCALSTLAYPSSVRDGQH